MHQVLGKLQKPFNTGRIVKKHRHFHKLFHNAVENEPCLRKMWAFMGWFKLMFRRDWSKMSTSLGACLSANSGDW
jgi:hypothetical protein